MSCIVNKSRAELEALLAKAVEALRFYAEALLLALVAHVRRGKEKP